MATERKTEPKLTEAAARTTAVLQTLQSRLTRDRIPRETPDELGEQLQQYFATVSTEPALPAKIPNDIRNLVIDGVVDRILQSWGEPNGEIAASIKTEIVGRLVENVLAELLKKGVMPDSSASRKYTAPDKDS